MENEEMTREEIWDKFTDLPEDTMADMAERATAGLFVFRARNFNDEIQTARELNAIDDLTLAIIIEDATNRGTFHIDEQSLRNWCLLDTDTEEIRTNSDLMELLREYEDEIIDGIEENEDLMDEIKGECLIRLKLNKTKY